MEAFVAGNQWARESGGRVTDRQMVELADNLHGWTRSVYKFGCAFIHLSCFHDYNHRDPLSLLDSGEREAILGHMRHYHGGPCSPNPTFDDLSMYLPDVFRKVASNLEHYVVSLEEDGDL